MVAGTRDAVMMVEAGAQELPEAVMLEAVRRGHEALQPIIDLQERMVAAIGKAKREVPVYVLPAELKAEVGGADARWRCAARSTRSARKSARRRTERLKAALLAHFAERIAGGRGYREADLNEAFQSELKALTRQRILDEGIRPDLRDLTTDPPDQL